MHNAPGMCSKAVGVGAAGDLFARGPHQFRAAHRAGLRHFKGLGVGRTIFDNNLYYLRDDVPSPLDQDRIPNPHVFSRHFVFIVQRGPGDRDPAHLHRLHHRHGGDRAGAPHVDQDVQDPCGLLGGRELVGQGPAGAPGLGPQALLQRQGVHLDHYPVDFIGQAVALMLNAVMISDGRLNPGAGLDQRIDPEAPFPQIFQNLPMGAESRSL